VIGAFFGTTFAHLFFQTYRDLAPAAYVTPATPNSNSQDSKAPSATKQGPYNGQKAPAIRVYFPKIYGFRVNERAKSGPRMLWLRLRPETSAELDMVDWRGQWICSEDDFEDDTGQAIGPRQIGKFDPVSSRACTLSLTELMEIRMMLRRQKGRRRRKRKRKRRKKIIQSRKKKTTHGNKVRVHLNNFRLPRAEDICKKKNMKNMILKMVMGGTLSTMKSLNMS
jgi:hypothetical protein